MNKRKLASIGAGIIQMASVVFAIVTLALILAPTDITQTRSASAESSPIEFQDPVLLQAELEALDPIFDAESQSTVELALLDGSPIPECEWTDDARRALTSMVLIESSSGRDALAIAWTMSRRWKAIGRHRGTSFADYIVETSHQLRTHRRVGSDDPRRLHRAGLSRHQVAAITAQLDEYDDVKGELDLWAIGTQPDPCAGSSFMWSAPWFRRSTKRVDCGDTANAFFELPRVSHARHVARLAEPITTCPTSSATQIAVASGH